jgi:hypothetical protein
MVLQIVSCAVGRNFGPLTTPLMMLFPLES